MEASTWKSTWEFYVTSSCNVLFTKTNLIHLSKSQIFRHPIWELSESIIHNSKYTKYTKYSKYTVPKTTICLHFHTSRLIFIHSFGRSPVKASSIIHPPMRTSSKVETHLRVGKINIVRKNKGKVQKKK